MCPIRDARRAFIGDEHSETCGPVDKDDDRRCETRDDEKRPQHEDQTSHCMFGVQSDKGNSISVIGCIPRTTSILMNTIAAEMSARNTMEEKVNMVRPLRKGHE